MDGRVRPAKLSKVHFSRKFQGKMHLNFWLSGSPISPYFHPKNLPIPPKVYLLKVQGTKSKASIDFHCPLWQIPLSSRQLIRIQTLLSPLWSPSRFVLAILHEQAFPKYILQHICSKNMFFGNACLCNLSLFEMHFKVYPATNLHLMVNLFQGICDIMRGFEMF